MTEPFGDLNFEGPRPAAKPIDRGEWRPFAVYMLGDIVSWDGETYQVLCDYKSGALSPDLVDVDYPASVWARL